MLEEGKRVHPNAQWWIKADGCDLVEVLGESVDGDWSGDVDLNDGEVARQHSEYTDRLSHIEDLCKDLTMNVRMNLAVNFLNCTRTWNLFQSVSSAVHKMMCGYNNHTYTRIDTYMHAYTHTQFCRRQIQNMRTKLLLDMLPKKTSMA